MDLLTIMVVSSTMKDRSDCYVKLVKTNYHDSEYECIFPKIHLIFLSKRDYIKITKIDKMFEKYDELEHNKEENILYNYLKEIIKHLRECEVMEVFSDHIEAFHMKFRYISRFIDKVPCYPKDYDDEVSERMRKKIYKAYKLLNDKIRYE